MTSAVKTVTVIRRREGVSHEQLVAHWRSPHAPGVKAHMKPDRYAITFFDPRDGRAAYDGIACLGFEDAEKARARTGRNTPPEVGDDGFLDLVELPMQRLTVTEQVIVAGPGSDQGGGAAARTQDRESSFVMTFLVSARPAVATEQIHQHWLEKHAPNVASGFVAAGGVRYVVNLVDPAVGTPAFVGVAQLSYRDKAAAKNHRIPDDGFNDLTTGIALPGRELVVVL